MMLSPSTVTRAGTAALPVNFRLQPDVFPVAVKTKVVADVSPVVGTDRMSHLPATSARLMGAGATVVVADVVVEDATALVVSMAASFLAHPARAAAQQQIAMRVVRCSVNIKPPRFR
jgi:hypothetical protein